LEENLLGGFWCRFGVVCNYLGTTLYQNPNRSEAEFTEGKSEFRNPKSKFENPAGGDVPAVLEF